MIIERTLLAITVGALVLGEAEGQEVRLGGVHSGLTPQQAVEVALEGSYSSVAELENVCVGEDPWLDEFGALLRIQSPPPDEAFFIAFSWTRMRRGCHDPYMDWLRSKLPDVTDAHLAAAIAVALLKGDETDREAVRRTVYGNEMDEAVRARILRSWSYSVDPLEREEIFLEALGEPNTPMRYYVTVGAGVMVGDRLVALMEDGTRAALSAPDSEVAAAFLNEVMIWVTSVPEDQPFAPPPAVRNGVLRQVDRWLSSGGARNSAVGLVLSRYESRILEIIR